MSGEAQSIPKEVNASAAPACAAVDNPTVTDNDSIKDEIDELDATMAKIWHQIEMVSDKLTYDARWESFINGTMYRVEAEPADLAAYLLDMFGRETLIRTGFATPRADGTLNYCVVLSERHCLFKHEGRATEDGRAQFRCNILFHASASVLEMAVERRTVSLIDGFDQAAVTGARLTSRPDVLLVTEDVADAHLLSEQKFRAIEGDALIPPLPGRLPWSTDRRSR
jgi:hypothetical protein